MRETVPAPICSGCRTRPNSEGPAGRCSSSRCCRSGNELPGFPASTVYDVDEDRGQVSIPLPPDAWYVAGIPDAQRFGNTNWSPDWPLSADLTVDYAQASEPTFPEQIDGVFAVTPVAMQKLMPGVGPYRIPTGNRISAGRSSTSFSTRRTAPSPSPRCGAHDCVKSSTVSTNACCDRITRPSSSRDSARRSRRSTCSCG